jgi:hypothetical protein
VRPSPSRIVYIRRGLLNAAMGKSSSPLPHISPPSPRLPIKRSRRHHITDSAPRFTYPQLDSFKHLLGISNVDLQLDNLAFACNFFGVICYCFIVVITVTQNHSFMNLRIANVVFVCLCVCMYVCNELLQRNNRIKIKIRWHKKSSQIKVYCQAASLNSTIFFHFRFENGRGQRG